MEEYLSNLYSNTSFPLLSAFLLGLMTAISPCPLATNITAIGYISKDLQNKRKVFVNGLIYTLGRVASYTILAMVLYFGVDKFSVASLFQGYGEKIIGFILILLGLLMLDFIKIPFPAFNKAINKLQQGTANSSKTAFLLGIIFALTFCPYSGVLYFGMLIPLTVSTGSYFVLPLVFSIATSIVVIVFATLIAFAISGVGSVYKHLKSFEFWFRRIVAVLFIIVGIYYIILIFV